VVTQLTAWLPSTPCNARTVHMDPGCFTLTAKAHWCKRFAPLSQGRALGMDQILGRMAEEKQKKLQAGAQIIFASLLHCDLPCV